MKNGQLELLDSLPHPPKMKTSYGQLGLWIRVGQFRITPKPSENFSWATWTSNLGMIGGGGVRPAWAGPVQGGEG